jgi:hypothetical protein
MIDAGPRITGDTERAARRSCRGVSVRHQSVLPQKASDTDALIGTLIIYYGGVGRGGGVGRVLGNGLVLGVGVGRGVVVAVAVGVGVGVLPATGA